MIEAGFVVIRLAAFINSNGKIMLAKAFRVFLHCAVNRRKAIILKQRFGNFYHFLM